MSGSSQFQQLEILTTLEGCIQGPSKDAFLLFFLHFTKYLVFGAPIWRVRPRRPVIESQNAAENVLKQLKFGMVCKLPSTLG